MILGLLGSDLGPIDMVEQWQLSLDESGSALVLEPPAQLTGGEVKGGLGFGLRVGCLCSHALESGPASGDTDVLGLSLVVAAP